MTKEFNGEILLKVSVTPEDPSEVALELAEAMQSEITYEAEIRHYKRQIEQERMKLRDLMSLQIEVGKKREEGYTSTRRMDPWAEYDLDKIEDDLQDCKNRASKYGEIIKEQQQFLQDIKNKIPRIRARLNTAKEAAKKG